MALDGLCVDRDFAAQLIDGRCVGRLRASIARQPALADHDHSSFMRHAARALDVAQTEPVADDHAAYAIRAYVASQVALGFIGFGQPAKAIELLFEHHHSWQDDQQHDYAIACARLVRAFMAVHDCHSAVHRIDGTTRGYLATPSDRARRELRMWRRVLRDRARSDKNLPLHTPRKRIEAAVQGDPQP